MAVASCSGSPSGWEFRACTGPSDAASKEAPDKAFFTASRAVLTVEPENSGGAGIVLAFVKLPCWVSGFVGPPPHFSEKPSSLIGSLGAKSYGDAHSLAVLEELIALTEPADWPVLIKAC